MGQNLNKKWNKDLLGLNMLKTPKIKIKKLFSWKKTSINNNYLLGYYCKGLAFVIISLFVVVDICVGNYFSISCCSSPQLTNNYSKKYCDNNK